MIYIYGGEIIDPAQGLDRVKAGLVLENGKIMAVVTDAKQEKEWMQKVD